MNTHANKTKKDKAHSVTDETKHTQTGGEYTFQFMDNRPEAIAQRKLQEIADNSPKERQLNAFQKEENHTGLEKEANEMGEKASISQGRSAQFKSHANNAKANLIIQRKPITVAISGLTHLVAMKDGSLFEGNEAAEVTSGQKITIDSEKKYRSRRGPNQETFGKLDAEGPSIYRWFKVTSLGNTDISGDNIWVRDDAFTPNDQETLGGRPSKISDANRERPPESSDGQAAGPWLIFGTSGRSREQIRTAIQKGYRTFDCAESYNNIALVAAAIQDEALDRDEYELNYKFDVNIGNTRTDILGKLMPVSKLFSGRLDSVLIHNIDADQTAVKTAWDVLLKLKKSGHIKKAGLGNLTGAHAGLVKELNQQGGVDIVENSLSSVLIDQVLQEIIQDTGAEVHYYDVRATALEVIQSSDEQLDMTDMIKGLVYMANLASGRNSRMILSSSSGENQQANLSNFGKGESREELESYTEIAAIDKFQKSQRFCQANDPYVIPNGPIKDFLDSLGNGNAIRMQIGEAVGGTIEYGQVQDWLVEHNHLSRSNLNDIVVPARIGLNKRYVGMTLGHVLGGFLRTENCSHKWAIELINLLKATAAIWDEYLGAVSEEITK